MEILKIDGNFELIADEQNNERSLKNVEKEDLEDILV